MQGVKKHREKNIEQIMLNTFFCSMLILPNAFLAQCFFAKMLFLLNAWVKDTPQENSPVD